MKRILDLLFLELVLKRPKLRRQITKLLYPNENVRVTLFDVLYEINKRKESFFYRAYLRSMSLNVFRHEAPQITNLALLLKSNHLFVDIGANVGLHLAVYVMLMSIFLEFKVYAFEPNPETFARLKMTAKYAMNQIMKPENICLINKGVSNSNNTLKFVNGAGSSEFGLLNKSGWQVENEITLVKYVA